MGVRGDVGHTVALLDAQRLQCGRPSVTALEELGVGQAQRAVDDRFPTGYEARLLRANSRGVRGTSMREIADG